MDFVLEQDGKLLAVEVKASSAVTTSDADGILAFRKSLGESQRLVTGVVLHGGTSRPLGRNLYALS